MTNFFKRTQAVLQVRTGFVAVATSILGLSYSIGSNLDIKWLVMVLFITAAFAINITTNIANGISGAHKEDTLDTINDDYVGKNGLVTGKTKRRDAYLALFVFTAYTIGAGLLICILERSVLFFLIGISAVLVALGYSLGPKPLTNYPLSEIISGFYCGFIPVTIIPMFNGATINSEILMLGIIAWITVGMLMMVNNVCDIEKDTGHRTTFPILVGANTTIKLFAVDAIIVGILGMFVILAVSLKFLALVFVAMNILFFNKWFYAKLQKDGLDIERNKGIYIPSYLKYYYRTLGLLSIILICGMFINN